MYCAALQCKCNVSAMLKAISYVLLAYDSRMYVVMPVHRDILHGRPVELELQGLEYMNDDPDKVDVLYAKVASADG